MDVCLRMLKESKNRTFNSYSVRNSSLIISHTNSRDKPKNKSNENLFTHGRILNINLLYLNNTPFILDFTE